MPGLEVARAAPRPRESIAGFLRRTGWAVLDRRYGWQFRKGLPTVCEIDGEAADSPTCQAQSLKTNSSRRRR
jgi:hypothetical protein